MSATIDPMAMKRELLAGLAQALRQLGGRLRLQEETALRMATLVGRAETVAAHAAELSRTRNASAEMTTRLAQEVAAFVHEVAVVADHARKSALDARALADALSGHAREITTFAASKEVLSLPELRAQLRPLASTLSDAPARFSAPQEIRSEVSALAEEALSLAERANGLSANGRAASVVAVSIYKELRSFAEHAASLSDWIGGDVAVGIAAAEAIANQATAAGEGRPQPVAPIPGTAFTRVQSVVQAGVEAGGRLWAKT